MFPLSLASTVSRSHRLDLDDVLKTKKALQDRGYYEEPDYGMTPYSDERMFDGIRAFQKDNGLRVDGVMHPDGETVQAMNKVTRSPDHSSKPGSGVPSVADTQQSGGQTSPTRGVSLDGSGVQRHSQGDEIFSDNCRKEQEAYDNAKQRYDEIHAQILATDDAIQKNTWGEERHVRRAQMERLRTILDHCRRTRS